MALRVNVDFQIRSMYSGLFGDHQSVLPRGVVLCTVYPISIRWLIIMFQVKRVCFCRNFPAIFLGSATGLARKMRAGWVCLEMGSSPQMAILIGEMAINQWICCFPLKFLEKHQMMILFVMEFRGSDVLVTSLYDLRSLCSGLSFGRDPIDDGNWRKPSPSGSTNPRFVWKWL